MRCIQFSIAPHDVRPSSVHSNTDKLSDEEKIPIAIAGLVGISLPFIMGLIALYAAKG
jgi:hypothetical protein